MAYESPRVDTLHRWLQPFLQVAPGKLVIALRPKDFGDELVLEQAVRDLTRRTGISQFAFHDFEQLLDIAP
jgi:hypothetical protein